jgi:hypothetical protein
LKRTSETITHITSDRFTQYVALASALGQAIPTRDSANAAGEDDYRRGDEILNAMPAGDTPGRRSGVAKYQVAHRMTT